MRSMPPDSSEVAPALIFLDAGILIGALLRGDSRHSEARPLVELARQGDLPACTTASVLSEVYGALTWEQAQPQHPPAIAAEAVRLLIEPPSAILVLEEGRDTILLALHLAAQHHLTARRVHDARRAAAAFTAGVRSVYTYDVDDWQTFIPDGLSIVGPPSVLARSTA